MRISALLLLIFSLFLSSFYLPPSAGATTVNRQVGVGSDDAHREGSPPGVCDNVLTTGTTTHTGYFSGGPTDAKRVRDGGYRFTNVTIPGGVTIDSAIWDGYLIDGVGAPTLKIQGQLIVNAPTFDGTCADWDGRSKTAASVNWAPGGTINQWYSSAELKSIIQEIVDQGTWASGNALVLFVQREGGTEGNQRQWNAFEGTAANAPKLTINYRLDVTAPAAVTNLAAGNPTVSSIKLTWTAPGDDGTIGTATSYDVRYSTSTIPEANWGSATQASGEPAPSPAGSAESMTVSGLSSSTTYFFALKTSDEEPNVSGLSNVPPATTLAPDVAPPSITNVQATNITQTTAAVTWNTNEPATSQVEYGTSPSYGIFSPFNGSLVTFHSVNLSGLSADTTYHFRVYSKDADNNQSVSSNFTFKTSGTPVTQEAGAKQLPGTPRVGAPAIETDKTPPQISLDPPSPNPTKVPTSKFTGNATEETGIISILQFSLNGGKSWHPVKDITGLGTKKATFTFATPPLEDGNYDVVARAIDNSDNTGLSQVVVLVIDVLPPIIGGHIATLGPQVLTPGKNGFVPALVGSDQRIILSAIGGPTKIEVRVGKASFTLAYSRDTRLWSGRVRFSELGYNDLKVFAQDGAGNTTERTLGAVSVLSGGVVLDGETGKPIPTAEVYLYFFEPVTKLWVLWDAASFGLKNPNLTDKNGQYSFFVPPGRYYLSVQAPGYRSVASAIVTLERGSLLGFTFRLPPRPFLTLPFFGLTLTLPSFLDFLVAEKEIPQQEVSLPEPRFLKVGQEIPPFSLVDLQGREVLASGLKGKLFLTFGSTWSPSFSEQAPILSALAKKNIPFFVIFLQEKASVVETFLKRGNYAFLGLVDPLGTLAESYKVLTLPQHVFIENNQVKEVESGVLEESKFESF